MSISFAQTSMRHCKHETNAPSRFLREIAPQYLDKPLMREKKFPERPVSRPVTRTITPKPATPVPETRPDIIDANFTPDPMTSFKAGERIEHNRFGKGEILEIAGKIPELKAKVRFEQYGEKILLLKYAKLRHV